VTTVLVTLYVWGVVSIWTKTMQDIPIGVYTFAGIVLLGKVGSIWADKPASNTSSITETSSKVTQSEGTQIKEEEKS
jgi:hypothetical protein